MAAAVAAVAGTALAGSVVSKRRDAPYRSGECRDWVKVKTTAWRKANRERWRLFERMKAGAGMGKQIGRIRSLAARSALDPQQKFIFLTWPL